MAEAERTLDVKIDVSDFERTAKAFADIGQNVKPALRRAVNHTGDKARTQMVRALVEQTGLKYGVVREQLKTERAHGGPIVYSIKASGGYIALKEFGARQTLSGVSAAPWGKRRIFPHTFIVASLGGNVFERTTKARFPIRKLWGPALPNEMVKNQSRAAFEETVNADLPARIEYEISAILAGHAP